MTDPSWMAHREDLADLNAAVSDIRRQIQSFIVGQTRMVDLLVAAILADGHVLIEGVPGVAKTLAARLMARTFDVSFSRIQFTPDLMPSDVLGTSVYNLQKAAFEFKKGPVFAHLLLIDEINRAPAKTQAALFEVMEERQVTVDGATHVMERPFLVIGTQNPIEQEGTYRLPEAQLDRFLFKITVPYPSLEEETEIIRSFHARESRNDLSRLTPVLTAERVRVIQDQVRRLHIEERLIGYIAALIHHSRSHPGLYLGGSPRASLNVMTAAKAIAAMEGRDFVTPEDIQAVLYPVLRHRLLLTPEKEMEGVTTDTIIREVIESVDVPR